MSEPIPGPDHAVWNVPRSSLSPCLEAGARTAIEQASLFLDIRQESERSLLRLQVEHAPDGILLVDRYGFVRAWNGRLREMFDLPDAVLDSGHACSVLEVMASRMEDPVSFMSRVSELSRNLDTREEGTEIRLADGRVLERHSLGCSNGDGMVWGRVWYYRDVSRRKYWEESLLRAREEACTAEKAKKAFLAAVCHEMRTPANILLGMCDLMREFHPNDAQRECLEVAARAGRLLMGLLDDMLELSRLEAPGFRMENQPFRPREALEEVVLLLDRAARGKGVILTWEVDALVAPWLLGDGRRLRQLLLNLCQNALKHTHEGRIHLSLYRDGPGWIRHEVLDTGLGIPSDRKESIFHPFVQGEDGLDGVGLGLSICRALVEKMGGEIGVESSPGKGSLFYFRLPWEEVAAPAATVATRARDTMARPLSILLAEDVEEARLLIQKYLRQLPHRLVTVENGALALERFRAESFDLVLMDLTMPVMDGFQAAAAVRRLENEEGRTASRLVALTGHASHEVQEEIRYWGFDACLSKPLRKKRLLELIEEVAADGGG